MYPDRDTLSNVPRSGYITARDQSMVESGVTEGGKNTARSCQFFFREWTYPEIMPCPYYPFMSLYVSPLEPKKQRSKKKKKITTDLRLEWTQQPIHEASS